VNQAIATRDTNAAIVESVIVKGDLSKLTPVERTDYYRAVCDSVGLNPLTQPLAYITLNGKLTLYALKGATDQLRKLHDISVEIVSRKIEDGILTVHVRAKDKDGRTDEDLGFASVANLKGEALGNAVLKAVTKAKRRVTLSIAGLGMLDETEVEDIPAPVRKTSHQLKQEGGDDVMKSLTEQVRDATTVPDLQALHKQYANTIATWPADWQNSFEQEIYEPKLAELREAARHRPRRRAEAETGGDDAPATLSPEDSAKLLNSMIGMMGRMEARMALRSWVEDAQVLASIATLTDDDKDTLRTAYENRKEALPE
jgi:hypothetical protein